MKQMKYPEGVSDFKALVTGGFYFVDKTGLICDLCGTVNQTLLFTRPRRFGKSINLSMIDRKRYGEDPDSECAVKVGLGIRQKSVKAVFGTDQASA